MSRRLDLSKFAGSDSEGEEDVPKASPRIFFYVLVVANTDRGFVTASTGIDCTQEQDLFSRYHQKNKA